MRKSSEARTIPMPKSGMRPRKYEPTPYEEALVMEMARTLASYRTKRGLTQKQIAKYMEWSHGSVVNMETGRQWVPIVKIAALLKIYGISLTHFFMHVDNSVNSKNEVIKNGTSKRL